MSLILLAALWLACGVVSVGIFVAYFEELSTRDDYRETLGGAIFLGIIYMTPVHDLKVGGITAFLGHVAEHHLFQPTTGATLAHSEHRRLANGPASGVQLFRFVLVPFLSADVRLIDFNDALQLPQVFPAGFAEPMEQGMAGRFIGGGDSEPPEARRQ